MAIHLSRDLEERIREKVDSGAARSIEDFVDRILRQALGPLSDGKASGNGASSDEIESETDAFFAALDQDLPSDLPNLPDAELTRDAIYEDRG